MGLSYSLALLSKEPAVMLAPLATLYEHGVRNDRGSTSLSQKVARYSLLWALAIAYMMFRAQLLGSLAPVARRIPVSWGEAVLSAFPLAAQYVWKLLWPVDLCAFYVFEKSTRLAEPRVMTAILAVLLLSALLIWLWRRNRAAAFALVWLGAFLLPALNARWMAANVFAERYLFLPSLGFCWLAAQAWTAGWQRAGRVTAARKLLVTALALVAALYTLRVVTRNRDWRDDEALYTQTLRVSPDAYLIRTNLGSVYWNRGDQDAAVREWQRSLQHNPDDPIVLHNLALLHASQKRYAEAEATLRRAIRVRPASADPYFTLGKIYEETRRNEDARREYENAIRRAPLHTNARNRLGLLLLRAENLAEAEEQFRASLEADPTAPAAAGLGVVLLKKGELAAAESALRQALELNPFEWMAHAGLGELLERTGRLQEALTAYEEAARLNPADRNLARRRETLRQSLKRTVPR
jgi:Flp pilus assembly protein TadD